MVVARCGPVAKDGPAMIQAPLRIRDDLQQQEAYLPHFHTHMTREVCREVLNEPSKVEARRILKVGTSGQSMTAFLCGGGGYLGLKRNGQSDATGSPLPPRFTHFFKRWLSVTSHVTSHTLLPLLEGPLPAISLASV